MGLTPGLLGSGLGLTGLALTTGLLGTAAVVVGQADDHLPCSMAHGQGHSRAVVLHGLDGVVVTAVHAAAVFRRLPKLPVGMGNTGAVRACYGSPQRTDTSMVPSERSYQRGGVQLILLIPH